MGGTLCASARLVILHLRRLDPPPPRYQPRELPNVFDPEQVRWLLMASDGFWWLLVASGGLWWPLVASYGFTLLLTPNALDAEQHADTLGVLTRLRLFRRLSEAQLSDLIHLGKQKLYPRCVIAM